jgi:hypothetical protein
MLRIFFIYVRATTDTFHGVYSELKGLGHEIEFKYFDKNGYF